MTLLAETRVLKEKYLKIFLQLDKKVKEATDFHWLIAESRTVAREILREGGTLYCFRANYTAFRGLVINKFNTYISIYIYMRVSLSLSGRIRGGGTCESTLWLCRSILTGRGVCYPCLRTRHTNIHCNGAC